MNLKLLKKTEEAKALPPASVEIVQPQWLQRRLPLSERPVTIGRDTGCDLRLELPDISRCHARVYPDGECWVLEDCGSRNGIFLNGERVGRRELQDGDLFRIGEVALRFNGALPPPDLGNVRKLLDISLAMSSTLDPDEALQRIIDPVAEISGAERAFLMLVNEAGDLEFKIARNIERTAVESADFKISRSVANEAATGRRPVVIEHVPVEGATASMTALGLKAVACIPMIHQSRVIGVIYTDSRRPNWIKDLDIQILGSLASQAAIAIENSRLNQEQKEAFFNTSMALAEAIEARDPYTAGHSRRVTNNSLLVGRALGLENKDLDLLRIGSTLHDVGKIGIEDCVLRKPGELAPHEVDEIRRHPDTGSRILAHVPQLSGVASAVRHHHERFDGGGYPDGLQGEEIPLLARIITVADAFDALTSSRVYRQKRHPSIALQTLREKAGSQFDPAVVEAFLRLYQEGRIEVEAQTDEEIREVANSCR